MVLKRKTLPVLGPSLLGDQEAMASSPVLRKWEFSTMEWLVPLQKFTPSAYRLRKRLPVITSPLDGPPTQYPTFVCSTQIFSSREPVPAPPLKPFSGDLSSRWMVSPRMAKSKNLQLFPLQLKRA